MSESLDDVTPEPSSGAWRDEHGQWHHPPITEADNVAAEQREKRVGPALARRRRQDESPREKQVSGHVVDAVLYERDRGFLGSDYTLVLPEDLVALLRQPGHYLTGHTVGAGSVQQIALTGRARDRVRVALYGTGITGVVLEVRALPARRLRG